MIGGCIIELHIELDVQCSLHSHLVLYFLLSERRRDQVLYLLCILD